MWAGNPCDQGSGVCSVLLIWVTVCLRGILCVSLLCSSIFKTSCKHLETGLWTSLPGWRLILPPEAEEPKWSPFSILSAPAWASLAVLSSSRLSPSFWSSGEADWTVWGFCCNVLIWASVRCDWVLWLGWCPWFCELPTSLQSIPLPARGAHQTGEKYDQKKYLFPHTFQIKYLQPLIETSLKGINFCI